MKYFRPNDERAKWVKIGLSLAIITTVILTISNSFQLELLLRWADGAEVDMDEADFNDARQEIIVIAYYLFRVFAGVCFIFWFRRAYFNLHQKLKSLNFSDGWAAGAWFVPFINLGRPYRIMKELYTESEIWLKTKGVDVERASENYLIPWWVFWLITLFLGRIVDKMDAETVDDLIELTQVAIGAGVLEIIAGLLVWKVTIGYIKREQLMMKVERQEDRRGELSASSGKDEELTIAPTS